MRQTTTIIIKCFIFAFTDLDALSHVVIGVAISAVDPAVLESVMVLSATLLAVH